MCGLERAVGYNSSPVIGWPLVRLASRLPSVLETVRWRYRASVAGVSRQLVRVRVGGGNDAVPYHPLAAPTLTQLTHSFNHFACPSGSRQLAFWMAEDSLDNETRPDDTPMLSSAARPIDDISLSR
jgi:hypothetical protein